jgi:hypothetical protein
MPTCSLLELTYHSANPTAAREAFCGHDPRKHGTFRAPDALSAQLQNHFCDEIFLSFWGLNCFPFGANTVSEGRRKFTFVETLPSKPK